MTSLFSKENGSKFLLWSLLVIVLDQLTKYWISSTIPVDTVGYRVASFFSIVHVWNEGAAFSFLASMGGWQRYFFMGIAVVICAVLLFCLLRTSREKKWTCLAISLVIGGALGNLIDRILWSHVIDFLLFYIKTDSFFYAYPAFNVADIAVCCGAGLLVIIGFLGKEDPIKK
ncbi:signal peptidase II [Succinivibrio dextrinosolvens]|jgi:signal peptidase II|uniref:signal peptidase II n=1 Tax=Succinivibrio dextrinosolvens TaxID=83771 RepID=UPI0008E88CEF|nr:signal peptidase II [Succinivibrio dextrinosolvens]SFS46198.1 signal peptidase II [Succinivibrio dextrinosolvens]